ncbi:MAG: 6-phosphogluconolactonase [Nanoarchaeota archaeon]|nr:6-phosphogluconolactonase [Nanoarchaeota archaeon]
METVNGNRDELDLKVVELIRKTTLEILKEKDFVVFGIPGGKSVTGVFEKLKNFNLPWEKIHIFMVDERFVPLTDKESNFGQAQEIFIGELFRKGKLPEENVHPFVFSEDKAGSVSEYEEEFKEFGGKFDVVLLGLGGDGHIASLFPEHDEFQNEGCFVYVNDSPKLPKERMSVTRKVIEKSGTVILLVYGSDKKEAYKKFSDEEVSVEACPAKLIFNVKDSYVFVSN